MNSKNILNMNSNECIEKFQGIYSVNPMNILNESQNILDGFKIYDSSKVFK